LGCEADLLGEGSGGTGLPKSSALDDRWSCVPQGRGRWQGGDALPSLQV